MTYASEGRLTLDPSRAVMSVDTTSANLYFVPYGGQRSWAPLALSLAGLVANGLYDIYLAADGGSIFAGPQWAANAPSIADVMVGGVPTDGAGNFYLGTIQIDPTAGQCTAHFSRGINRRFGVWNYYNRKGIVVQVGKFDGTTPQDAYTLPTAINPVGRDPGNNCTILIGRKEERASITIDYNRRVVTPAGCAMGDHCFGVGWNTLAAMSGVTGNENAEYDPAHSVYLARGFTSHAVFDPDPFCGVGVATALEQAIFDPATTPQFGYALPSGQAWNIPANFVMTARWMG